MAEEIKKADMSKASAVARYADPFSAMRSEMDRVFDAFMGRGGSYPSLFRGGGSEVTCHVDVHETPSEMVVEAELPGLEEKDVSVTLNDGILTLKGEKQSNREDKSKDYHITERSYGSFQRSFRVGDTVDVDRVRANFDKGLLKITLPKRPEAASQEKKIPIGKG